jgi:dsDNA-specific endonuclease/ATPase MutS2
MEFSVVEVGYDQAQVDSCLEDLSRQLARMAAQAEAAAEANTELDLVREEVERLRGLLSASPGPYRTSSNSRLQEMLAVAEEEAAGILARARDELAAAREEARLVREQVYAEAVQARRDFEAALHARRQREEQVDEILREVPVVHAPDPANAGGAPTAVPATRAAAGGQADRTAAEPTGPSPERPRPADGDRRRTRGERAVGPGSVRAAG